MELELTREQREAVERRDGSLFLHAAAGSGKTRVLVERFVRAVVDDGVAVDRILAITFTEKAASELKARLRRRFLALGQREKAREAESAWVSTIHGFCSRLLRANALAAGLDPEYRVLDEGDAARLSVEAFDLALEDFVLSASRGGGERLDLVATYTPDKLQRMVTTVHSRLRSRGEREPRLPDIPLPVLGEERARLERALSAAATELGAATQNKTVAAALDQIERCGKALEAVAPDDFGDVSEFEGLGVRRGNAVALRGEAFDELEAALSAWQALCAGKRAHADYVLLSELLELYDRRYAHAKSSISALDFDDLELGARDLLRDAPALRAATRERFLHVMVDEFQDTNPLQNQLLDFISGDDLFVVGDEHQSIYGFRNADISVFRDRRDKARASGRDARLAVNFRSRPEVVDAINRAFAGVWGDGYEPLALPEAAPAREPAPRVELLMVDRSNGVWDALGEEPFGHLKRKLPVWRAAEARLLALRIEQLVQAGECGYGDVAVLLRAASDMGAYERALEERGIPTYATGAGGYWSQQQVGDLRAYLAALANPRDDLALYNVLASPLCGASLDALPIVRSRAKAVSRDLWWALEEAFGPGGDGSGDLAGVLEQRDRERVAGFVRRFAEERRAAPRMSLETLVDRAVTRSGYDRFVLSLSGGARRMANVRKLMRLAREYEAEFGRDLRGFIDFVDERELLTAREGEAPLEGEGLDAVRLMTVHAAKGLEFPVVCVADLGREGRGDDGPLQVSPDGRVGLQVMSLSGGSHGAMEMEAIKAEQEELAEQEERRIFYVAMTRAQSRLIVSGGVDASKWGPPKPLGAPIDWVWPALAPGAKQLLEQAPEGIEDGVRCVLLSPATADEVLPPDDRRPGAASVEPRGIDFARPHFPQVAEAVPLPVARLSYSALESYKRCSYRFYLERVVKLPRPAAELVAEDGILAPDEGDQLALTETTLAPDGLSPLLRGTIVHELLERVDFRRPRPPSRAEIAEQLAAHSAEVDEEDVAGIAALIGGFLDSDLFARLRAAQRVRKELPFAYPLEPEGAGGRSLLVNGVVDVHADFGERLLVVDYKTDALEGRDPEDVCAEKYEAQRLVYTLAGLRSGFGEVEVAYCFLERPDLVVSRVFKVADRERLEANLLELAAGVIGGRFEPAASPHRELCQFCPGQAALCSWPPERTLADRPEGETFAAPEPERQLS